MGEWYIVFGDASLAGSVSLGQGVSQGRDNVVLPNNFLEALGTPLTVKHQRLAELGCDKYRTDVPDGQRSGGDRRSDRGPRRR